MQEHDGLAEASAVYIPDYFHETRTSVLHALLTDNPLGTLITVSDGVLDANHIPFHFEPSMGEFGTLTCHVARVNAVWQQLEPGQDVLVVFRAEQAYVSPNWYPSKHEFHKQVPTWNYMVVHARGRAFVHDDMRSVRLNVAQLTKRHEATQPKPWNMGHAPREYTDSLLAAIVAIEIQITELTGKFKLGQNKELRDIHGAGNALIEQGDDRIGNAMLEVAKASELPE